jgi:hypothetical protein
VVGGAGAFGSDALDAAADLDETRGEPSRHVKPIDHMVVTDGSESYRSAIRAHLGGATQVRRPRDGSLDSVGRSSDAARSSWKEL